VQPLKPLHEQSVVITGASSGIGRATALMAARRGACVALASRDAGALHRLAEGIRREGGRALAIPTDVAVEDQVQALADRAADAFGGIDTWVNDAAVSAYGKFEQLPSAEFQRVVEIDFFGQANGCRAALPYLKEQGRGALICVGSALSDRAVPLQSAYCAAKHAVKALTESLRVELAAEGSETQVTLIKPSSMSTPLFDQAATHLGVKPKPMWPVYEPELVAEAILYAAEHHVRELTVGGAGKLLTTLETCAGPLMDWWLARTGENGQRSSQPKAADEGNNLFTPLPGHAHVHGSFKGRRLSLATATRLHPRRAALALGAVALGAGLIWRTRPQLLWNPR